MKCPRCQGYLRKQDPNQETLTAAQTGNLVAQYLRISLLIHKIESTRICSLIQLQRWLGDDFTEML